MILRPLAGGCTGCPRCAAPLALKASAVCGGGAAARVAAALEALDEVPALDDGELDLTDGPSLDCRALAAAALDAADVKLRLVGGEADRRPAGFEPPLESTTTATIAPATAVANAPAAGHS